MILHRHDLKLVTRSYAPPSGAAVQSSDVELIKIVAMGQTTLFFMCPCGENRVVKMLGREEKGVVEIKFTEVKR